MIIILAKLIWKLKFLNAIYTVIFENPDTGKRGISKILTMADRSFVRLIIPIIQSKKSQ